MRLLRLWLLASLAVPYLNAQSVPAAPTSAVFHASLAKLQKKELAEWQLTLQNFKVEELPITFAFGKLIERMRDQSLQWIQVIGDEAEIVRRTDSLADEINLAYVLNELMHSLTDLASMLANVDLPKGKIYETKNRWTEQLQSLSVGAVNTLSQDALSFASSQAIALENRCRR